MGILYQRGTSPTQPGSRTPRQTGRQRALKIKCSYHPVGPPESVDQPGGLFLNPLDLLLAGFHPDQRPQAPYFTRHLLHPLCASTLQLGVCPREGGRGHGSPYALQLRLQVLDPVVLVLPVVELLPISHKAEPTFRPGVVCYGGDEGVPPPAASRKQARFKTLGWGRGRKVSPLPPWLIGLAHADPDRPGGGGSTFTATPRGPTSQGQ